MLAEERDRLHKLPPVPHTICFGQTRRVSWQSTISVGGAIYSVPSNLVDERVWARADGSELIVVDADGAEGPREVARHALTTPGRPSIRDEHYPPKPAGALERKPRASTADERAFLEIGPGSEKWLKAAAAAGTTKLRRKGRRGDRAGQAPRPRGRRRGAHGRCGRRALRRWRPGRDPRAPRRAGDRVPGPAPRA